MSEDPGDTEQDAADGADAVTRELVVHGTENGLVVESDRFEPLGVVERDTTEEAEWLTATQSATMSADGAGGTALVGFFGDASTLDEPKLTLPRPPVDHLVVPDSFDEEAVGRAADEVDAESVTRVGEGESYDVTLDPTYGVAVTERSAGAEEEQGDGGRSA